MALQILVLAFVATSLAEAAKVATPTISPNGGTFTNLATVSLSCATPGATIRYTTNGANPTGSSPIYTGPFALTVSGKVKAIGTKNGSSESNVASASFTIQAGAPTISPSGGAFTNSVVVTLSTATSGATIRFTTNGTAPTSSSPAYTAPFTLTTSATVKAVTIKDGTVSSTVSSAAFTIQASAPTIAPSGGVFTQSVVVTLATATPGGTIRFTTNGTNPTSSSPAYAAPFTLSSSATVKAVTMKGGTVNSGVSSASFTIQASAPTIAPNGGTFTEPVVVALGTSTPGATIRYTVDGTLPTAASAAYAGSLTVASSATVTAVAFKAGMASSPATSADFVIQAGTPTINPSGGTFIDSVNVTLGTSTPGATIRYTTDASTPTGASPIYSAPFLVTKSTTVNAVAFKSGQAESAMASQRFTIETAAPMITPPGGALTGSATVTISSTTPGAIIRYTMDGSVPDISAQQYRGAIVITRDSTIRAQAVKSGLSDSQVTSAAFQILSVDTTVAAPVITPGGGFYKGSVSVGLSTPTPGATIFYTTDGSIPNPSSATFTAPFVLSGNQVVTAMAIKPGLADSDVVSAEFHVNPTSIVATPQISPAGGATLGPAIVTLTSATADADLYFTVDGSIPDSGSTLYSSPIVLGNDATLRAIGVKSGMAVSAVASATFTTSLASQVASPVISPDGGSFDGWSLVSLSSTTPEAVIRYSQDGTDPTPTSTMYAGPLTICTTRTLKAQAFKDGMADSEITTSTFTADNTLPVELSVASFGAVPDDGIDDTAACVSALLACANQSDSAAPPLVRLIFPKGRYDFQYGGNTVTGEPHRALPIRGCNNLTIDGQGSTLMFSTDSAGNQTSGFFADHDHHLVIKNFMFDLARHPFSAGTVVESTPTYFDVQVDPDFPLTEADPVSLVMQYDPDRRLPARNGFEILSGIVSTALVAPQRLRINLALSRNPVATGMFVSLLHQAFGPRPVTLVGCSDVQLENVTIYGSWGGGIAPILSEDVTFRQVRTQRRPDSSRLVSAAYDAVHALSCKGLMQFEDCSFEHQGDDGINVHGRYFTIGTIVDAQTIDVFYEFAPGAFPSAQVGERFEFLRGSDLHTVGENTAQSVVFDSATHTARITFSSPLPSGLVPSQDLIASAVSVARLRVNRCNFIGNRGRGALVQTRDAIVEGSRFEDTTSSGLHVMTSLRWFESSSTRQVTLRNNSFENCNYGVARVGGAIFSGAELRGGIDVAAPLHRDLAITDNTIRNTDNAGLVIMDVDGFDLRNNTIENCSLLAAIPFGEYAIYVRNSINGRVMDNQYVVSQAFAKGIQIGPGTSGVVVAGNSGFVSTNFNGAQFVSQTVPTVMTAGQTYPVSITMKNSGTTTWSAVALYRLGSQSPQDNVIWGSARFSLPGPVAPGDLVVFNLTLPAPSTPGPANFQWRMVQDSVEWFGDRTESVSVNITTGP